MHWKIKISISALILIVFLGGFLLGKTTAREASREIMIGYANTKNARQIIDFNKVITDLDSQSVVDNFMMIYLHKQPLPDGEQKAVASRISIFG